MDHRRTPARKVLTLPGWIIILSALICLGAGAYYAVLLVDDTRSQTVADSTTAPTTAPTTAAPTTPTPSPTPPPSPTPTVEKTTPAPEPTKIKPPVIRNAVVNVFNNTRTTGLARSVAGKVQAAGWQLGSIGNWRGSIPATTIYYPPGFAAQAQTLAQDLDFGRVRPAVAPMSTERLTLILSGQQ